MSKGKISVVIPVYNTVEYIERCVKSVLNQTYEDLEIVCVDDGSTDGSGEVLDKLAGEDSRVIVIHKANGGVSAARNEALYHATGEYITFVDSDDYIDECMYEKMVEKLCEEDVDIVTCGYSLDYEGDIRPMVNLKPVPEHALETYEFLRYIYERDTYKGVAGYLWTRVVKRKLIYGDERAPQIGFEEKFGVAEDIIFVAEITARAKKIAYLNEKLYFYFQRMSSVTHRNMKSVEVLQWPESYEKIMDIYAVVGYIGCMDIIERMYVYTCGKMLELAIKYKDAGKVEILRGKIKSKLSVYVETNLEHIDRIKWIVDLLLYEI